MNSVSFLWAPYVFWEGVREQIRFRSVNTTLLSRQEIEEIYQIEQDMWSREEGLWEYLKCSSCDTIFSKQDIYWRLAKNEYQKTVGELEQQQSRDIFSCTCCGWKLYHSFPKDKYIEEICDRYSRKAVLVLMEKWDMIIWFMDWYVDDFETIYDRELSDHYSSIWIEQIKSMVKDTLWWIIPQEFFSCSSSWTRERYMNMVHIYNLLRYFFENFPEDMKQTTALSELHAGWPYTRIFSSLWAESIGVRDRLSDKIYSTDTYASDIYVHRSFWERCNIAFTWKNRREFLSSLK